MQMRALKVLGSILAGAILLYLFVVNFSAVQSRFECSGEILLKGGEGATEPLTIYIRLEEYRWWVQLWGDSDGNLWVEIPNENFLSFNHLSEIGDQLQIFDGYGEEMELHGYFSKLSKFVSLKTPGGIFDGPCKSLQ